MRGINVAGCARKPRTLRPSEVFAEGLPDKNEKKLSGKSPNKTRPATSQGWGVRWTSLSIQVLSYIYVCATKN